MGFPEFRSKVSKPKAEVVGRWLMAGHAEAQAQNWHPKGAGAALGLGPLPVHPALSQQ